MGRGPGSARASPWPRRRTPSETAQSGGAPAAAVRWRGRGEEGGRRWRRRLGGALGRGQAHESRSSAPAARPRDPGASCRVSSSGVTTDSTPHQPPRPRALRSSAPHVTGPTCRRARLRGPEPSCRPRPPGLTGLKTLS